VVALSCLGCGGSLERIKYDTASSPDQLWTATVYLEVADRGFFSDYRKVVELRKVNEASSAEVLCPNGQWDGGEKVSLRWREPRVLEVSVPNRTDFTCRVRELDSIEIRVTYQKDDPEDRALWMRAVKAREAWKKDGQERGLPEPKIPLPREQ
jgi:hypothetical protein